MTAFATDPASLPDLTPDLPRPVRALATDSYIKARRAVTPDRVVEQRAVPRLSIQELNAQDLDQIKERFDATKFDNRGPVTRFLDLLDVPRNFIAGRILDPSLRRQKEAEGDVGAFGEGKVYTSDILNDLGVQNRVVRGVLGFVGDVALDPLTYAGGAGFGAKLAGEGGRAVTLTREGTSAIKSGIEAVRAGKPVADDLVKQALSHFSTEGAAAKDIADAASTHFFGSTGRRLSKAEKLAGGQEDSLLSQFANDVHTQPDQMTLPGDAARVADMKALYAQYGRHRAPGLRIGMNPETGRLGFEFAGQGKGTIDAGSGIAHIPFTDIGIYVPAFTKRARFAGIAPGVASATRGVSKAGPESDIAARLYGPAAAFDDDIRRTRLDLEQLDTIGEAHAKAVQSAAETARAGGYLSTETDAVAALENARTQTVARIDQRLNALKERVAGIRADVEGVKANPLSTPEDILHAGNMQKAALARVQQLESEANLVNAEKSDFAQFWDKHKGPLENAINARVGDVEDPVLRQQLAAEAHDTYRAGLDEDARKFIDAGEEAWLGREALVNTIHEATGAAQEYAAAARAPLSQTINGSKLTSFRDLAQTMLGINPDVIGPDFMSPLVHVTDSIMHDRGVGIDSHAQIADQSNSLLQSFKNLSKNAQQMIRRGFGVRGGDVYELTRGWAGANINGEASKSIVHDFMNDVRPVAKEFGLSPTDAATAVHLMLNGDKLPEAGDMAYTLLKDFKDRGVFNGKQYEGLYDELKRVADKWRPWVSDIGEQAVRRGDVQSLLRPEDYGTGNVLKPEARRRLSAQISNAGTFKGATGYGPAAKISESFQHQRSTLKHVWQDAEGNVKYVMEGDRIYSTFSPEDLAQLSQAGQEHAANMKALVAEMDAARAANPDAVKSFYVSPWELNRMHQEDGWGQLLFGGRMKDGPFDTNAAYSLASLAAQSERATLRKQFEELVLKTGLDVNSEKIDKVAQTPGAIGKVFTVNGGAQGRFDKDALGRNVLWIGDQRYRRPDLSEVARGVFDPLADTFDTKFRSTWLPENVASAIENVVKPFRNDDEIAKSLKMMDTISRYWKVATLSHASWTINDIVGSSILAMSMGITPAELIRHARNAIRIVMHGARGDHDALNAMHISLGGRDVNGSALLHELVQGGNRYTEAWQHLTQSGQMIFPSQYSLLRNPKQALSEMTENARKLAESEATGALVSKAPWLNKLKQAKAFVVDESLLRRWWAPWIKLNGMANDSVRTAAYMALLERGYDAETAARKVADGMLDMTITTDVERNLRRLVPFYSWLVRSGQLGIRQLAENPKFFTIAPHLIRNMEVAWNGDQNVPEFHRPQWLREQLALQIGSDPETRKAILIGTALPAESATHLFAGLTSLPGMQDFLQYIAGSLNPAVRVPLEIGAGRAFFTRQDISASPDQGDMSVGEYLGNQVRPLKELGIGTGIRKGPISAAFERSTGEGVARVLLGGRVQPATDDRLRSNLIREFKPIEQSIRHRIALAEREGNKEESLKARVQLLRLYHNAQQQGIGDAIPKYAAAQLQSLPGS